MKYVDVEQVQKKMGSRLFANNLANVVFLLATLFGLVVLLTLIYRVYSDSIDGLTFNLLRINFQQMQNVQVLWVRSWVLYG